MEPLLERADTHPCPGRYLGDGERLVVAGVGEVAGPQQVARGRDLGHRFRVGLSP